MAEASADKDRMLIAPLKLSDLLDKVTHSNWCDSEAAC